MTNKVGIGIEAKFDGSGVDSGLNKIVNKVSQANKTAYNPIGRETEQAIDRTTRKLEQLLKVDGELRRRAKATGQAGLPFEQWDMGAMYPNAAARRAKEAAIRRYLNGDDGASGGGGVGGGGGWGRTAAGMAQSGLRAAGPVGNVAANAIGTGMSAGFGAGLMGLMGGMLALGISKVVGAAMEKVGQAQDNAVALDRLKRTLGDVNVSFSALKTVVHSGADNLRITYAESERLATSFVKLGNVSNDQYKSLADELGVGVGFSRGFGLDPSQGMGMLGQMRGIGVTTNTQESRRFALLIGETIGKSGAFAKAEEVMSAITDYATSQTRNNMGVANVAGYAGMFSAMVGSGIPGMDPAGAAGLLGRINSSLSAGGARGEASQFFSGQVGAALGLDPIMTQMLREGGAFATNDSMFGQGSAYARFMGKAGPGGGTTFLQGTIERLRKAYGSNPHMLALATAGHLGIGVNQAMGLLSVDPNQMGEMQKYGDLSKLSGSGIGNLSKALYGSSSDRQALAQSLLGRDDVAGSDKDALRAAMGTPAEREMLAKLTAQYDQERTTGSDIRDSKNALDNLKTNMADKLIPLTQAMRDGILYIAGEGKKSSSQVLSDIAKLESEDRKRGINTELDESRKKAGEEHGAAKKARDELWEKLRGQLMKGEITQEQAAAQIKVADERIARAKQAKADAEEKAAKALKDEADRLKGDLESIKRSNMPGTAGGAFPSAGGGRGFINPPTVGGGGRTFSTGSAPPIDGDLAAKLAAHEQRVGLPPGTLRGIMAQETGGRMSEFLSDPSKYHYGLNANGQRIAGHTGRISTAFGPFGILESTGRRPGYGVAPLKDKSLDEQMRFAADYAAARVRAAGSLADGLAGYGEGPRYAAGVMSKMGTPLPPAANSYMPEFRVSADDITIRHVDANGMPVQPQQTLSTTVKNNWRPSMGY